VELRPTYEFTQLILSFGYDVKVLEPETYKQEIITNIRRNLQNYDIMQIDCTSQEQFCRK
ncbi:WCX domain-containing protein, partial [Phocaeicola dorei]